MLLARVWPAAALLFCSFAAAQGPYAPAIAEWNQPVEPFKIAGNLYYVGASDVSSYLIATPEGHILVDTGFRETLPLIDANMKKLGFRIEDVRLILTSHPHYDHVGALADLKNRTHARLLTSPADAAGYERGGRQDFAFGDKYPFPPVKADGLLTNEEAIGLGGATVIPHFTPGHTKGCTSYTLTVEEGGQRYRVAIVCSMTAPGYKLVDNQNYSQIASDFLKSFALLKDLPCDIFLSMHSWDFGLEQKIRARRANPAVNPFIDRGALRAFAEKGEASVRKQIEEQYRK